MLVHSLASTGKHARFVVLGPPRDQNIGLAPLLKSDDFFREPREIGPPPFKNPGHAPALQHEKKN